MAPRDSILMEADPDAFDRAANDVIATDARLLFDTLQALPNLVRDMRASEEDRFDVEIPLVNAAAVAATGLELGRRGVFEVALDALTGAYRLGDLEAEYPSDDDVRLFEGVVSALWAVGAVAVAKSDWAGVREIIARQPIAGGYWDSWLRHGQVMATRSATDPDDDNILDVAERRLARNPGFGMIERSTEERLGAAAKFDHLAYFVVASLDPEKRTNFYTSYAKYPVAFVEPSAIALRTDEELRRHVFPYGDQVLRDELREANEMAVSQAAFQRAGGKNWRYEGYQDPRTWMFIREGHLWEDWAGLPSPRRRS